MTPKNKTINQEEPSIKKIQKNFLMFNKLNKKEKEIIARERNKKCDKCGGRKILYEHYGIDMVDFECGKCSYSWCDEYEK